MSSDVFCVITEEPASKELRFRYDSERRPVSLNRPYSSAGCIPGVRSTPQNKTYPSIKVVNLKGRAIVVVCCVTVDPPHKPHPHRLVGLKCRSDYGGVCVKEVDAETKTATLDHVGILCVKRRDMPTAFVERQARAIDPFKTGFNHKEQPNSIDVNAVRLCFHVFLEGKTKDLFNVPICPVLSQPIYDKKSTSDFAIVDLSDCSAPVDGGRKIILLCQKVMKDDISIHFYEEVDGQIVWQGYGEFEPNDVHKQYAISFKTPPYKDLDVTEPVQVKIQLVRPSDDEFGPHRAFQLTPIKLVSGSHLPRKKAKMSIIPQLGEAEAELSRSKDTLFKLDLEREQEMRAADQPMPSTSDAFRQQSSYVYDPLLQATNPLVSQAVSQAASADAIASLQACHNAYKPPPFSQPLSNQSLPQMGQPPDPINMSQLSPQQIVNHLNLMHPQEHNIVHQHNPMQHNINIQEEHSPLQHNLVDGVIQQQYHQPQQHHYQQYQKQQQQHEQQEQQQHLQLQHYCLQQQQHQQQQNHQQQQQHQQYHHHEQQQQNHQQQQQHQQYHHHEQQQQQQQQHHHQQQQHQQYHHHEQQQQQQQHHHQQQQQQQQQHLQQYQQQQQHQQYNHHEQQQQQHHHHQQLIQHQVQTMDTQQQLTEQGVANQFYISDLNSNIPDELLQNLSLDEIEADVGILTNSLEKIPLNSLFNYNQNNDNNGSNSSPSGQNSN